jgi:hypothetical protein
VCGKHFLCPSIKSGLKIIEKDNMLLMIEKKHISNQIRQYAKSIGNNFSNLDPSVVSFLEDGIDEI